MKLSEDQIKKVVETYLQVVHMLEENNFSNLETTAFLSCFLKSMDENALLYFSELLGNELIKRNPEN